MIEASCHCGGVRLAFPEPEEVTDCNCSICRRYGVFWAYDSPRRVTIEATRPTETYRCNDHHLDFHRCATCGCVICWQVVDEDRDRMGVNARLMPLEALHRCRVRHLDGADTWSEWVEPAIKAWPGPPSPP